MPSSLSSLNEHAVFKFDLLPEDWIVVSWNFLLVIPFWEKESSMKRSKFTDAQIAFVLKQVEEGTSVAVACRRAGIAETTFNNWRKKYAGLKSSV